MSSYLTPNPLPLFVGGSRDGRARNTAQAQGVTLVQSAVANTGDTEPASLDVVLGTPATAGNLIVVTGNSDATLTGFSGSSLAASAVFQQGLYLWYKIAVGGETTLTATPSVGRPVALVAAEYSGIHGTPLDQTATATGSGSTTGPVTAGATGATGQAVELVLAATGPHSFNFNAQPNAPTWTNGFTTVRETASALTATAGRNAAVFLGELLVTSVGAQSTATSWTQSANDWGAVVATFKAA